MLGDRSIAIPLKQLQGFLPLTIVNISRFLNFSSARREKYGKFHNFINFSLES
jgi:hypothetical protein